MGVRKSIQAPFGSTARFLAAVCAPLLLWSCTTGSVQRHDSHGHGGVLPSIVTIGGTQRLNLSTSIDGSYSQPMGHTVQVQGSLMDRPAAASKGQVGSVPIRWVGPQGRDGADRLLERERWLAPEATLSLTTRQESAVTSETTGEVRLFEDRISLRFSSIRGSDIRDTGRLVPPDSPADGEWHREAHLSVPLGRSDAMALNLYGDMLDRRTFVRQDDLRLVQATDWERTAVKTLGLNVALLGGRFRYGNKYSLANYHTSSGEGDDVADAETAYAQGHRIDADLLESRLMNVSAYGLYSRIGPFYRAFKGSDNTGAGRHKSKFGSDRGPRDRIGAGHTIRLSGKGETRAFGTAAKFGFGELSFAQSQNLREDGKGSQTRTMAGSVDLGPTQVSLSRKDVANYSDSKGESRTLTYSGELELTLDELFFSSETNARTGFGRLLPSSVSLSGSRGTHEDVDVMMDRPDLETSLELGFSWDWGDAETDISVARTVYDSRKMDYGTTRTEERSIAIEQSFSGDNWDLSGSLSLSQEESKEEGGYSTDWNLSDGLDFSYSAEDLPDISLSIEYDLSKSFASDDDYESRDRSWITRVSLDFAKFVPIFADDDHPRLQLTYYGEGTSNYESEVGTSREWNHAIMISRRFRF